MSDYQLRAFMAEWNKEHKSTTLTQSTGRRIKLEPLFYGIVRDEDNTVQWISKPTTPTNPAISPAIDDLAPIEGTYLLTGMTHDTTEDFLQKVFVEWGLKGQEIQSAEWVYDESNHRAVRLDIEQSRFFDTIRGVPPLPQHLMVNDQTYTLRPDYGRFSVKAVKFGKQHVVLTPEQQQVALSDLLDQILTGDHPQVDKTILEQVYKITNTLNEKLQLHDFPAAYGLNEVAANEDVVQEDEVMAQQEAKEVEHNDNHEEDEDGTEARKAKNKKKRDRKKEKKREQRENREDSHREEVLEKNRTTFLKKSAGSILKGTGSPSEYTFTLADDQEKKKKDNEKKKKNRSKSTLSPVLSSTSSVDTSATTQTDRDDPGSYKEGQSEKRGEAIEKKCERATTKKTTEIDSSASSLRKTKDGSKTNQRARDTRDQATSAKNNSKTKPVYGLFRRNNNNEQKSTNQELIILETQTDDNNEQMEDEHEPARRVDLVSSSEEEVEDFTESKNDAECKDESSHNSEDDKRNRGYDSQESGTSSTEPSDEYDSDYKPAKRKNGNTNKQASRGNGRGRGARRGGSRKTN